MSAAARRLEGDVPRWFALLEGHRVVGFAGLALSVVAAVLLLPGWPASLLPVLGVFVPFALFMVLDRSARKRPRGLSLAVVAPSLIALLLIGMFYAGLAGSGLGFTRGAYQFTGANGRTGPGNGTYVELAQDSGLLYLHPCPSPTGNVVTVNEGAIETVTSEKSGDLGAGPSLWFVLFDHSQPRTGIRYACR